MKDLETVKDVKEITSARDWAMEVIQFIFSQSQDNLVTPMPWGDAEHSGNNRKDTIISDLGGLMQSGRPPRWEGDEIVFEYTAPYAFEVEYGSLPHEVKPEVLYRWVRKKLGVKGKRNINYVAEKVSMKIYEKGIEPHSFVRASIASAISKYNLKINPSILKL